MNATRPFFKRLQHAVEYALVWAFRLPLRLLPLRVVRAFGVGLGGLLWLLGLQVGLSRRNVAHAFPEYGAAQREKVVRRAYRFFGGMLFEVLVMDRLVGRLVRREGQAGHVRVENPEVIAAALARGKGVLVVSGHLGNWEFSGGALAASGFPASMYVGRQHNPEADGLINGLRRSMGTQTISEAAGMRGLIKALKANRVVCMLADQHFSRKEHFVRFMGQMASHVPGPALLALHTGAALVHASTSSLGPFQHRVRYVEIPVRPTGDEEWDVLAICQAMATTLEADVRATPEQYFWMHDRWKAYWGEEQLSPTNKRFLEASGPLPPPRQSP